jgi:hypothetical protein
MDNSHWDNNLKTIESRGEAKAVGDRAKEEEGRKERRVLERGKSILQLPRNEGVKYIVGAM